MTATQATRPDLPPRSWSRPAHKPDTSTITIAPAVIGRVAHRADSKYVDLHWTPIIGPTAVALLRWVNHQTRPVAVTEHQLASALGAPGTGDIRRAIKALIDSELATAQGTDLLVTVAVPNISARRARTLGRPIETRTSTRA